MSRHSVVTQLAISAVRLRTMDEADLPFVVGQHRYHFPDGFFARLGRKFLRRYYQPFLHSPYARAYLAERDGRPTGYLVGVIDPAGHRSHLLRTQGRALTFSAVGALAVRPRLALHFLHTRLGRYVRVLFGRRVPGRSEGVTDARSLAVLLHVAVAPKAQSSGVGSALIDRFVADAAATGCDRVMLVTAAGPGGAGPYYLRRGWELRGEHTTVDGRPLATYERWIAHST